MVYSQNKTEEETPEMTFSNYIELSFSSKEIPYTSMYIFI